MAELEDILKVRETVQEGDTGDKLAMMSPQKASMPQQAPMLPQQAPMMQQDLNKGMRGSEFEVIEDLNKGMRGVETLSPARMPTDDEVNKGILMALIEKRAEEAGINVEESVRTIMNISDMEKAKSSQGGLPMSAAPAMQQAIANPVMAAQGGGLMRLAAG